MTNPALLASKQATLASYLVALCISRKMNPHAIGHQLANTASIAVVRLVCDDDAALKLQSALLSSSEVQSYVADFSQNIKDQVMVQMKKVGK